MPSSVALKETSKPCPPFGALAGSLKLREYPPPGAGLAVAVTAMLAPSERRRAEKVGGVVLESVSSRR
ncbi:hypothetical protein D3C78_1961520 [compost metagenome]